MKSVLFRKMIIVITSLLRMISVSTSNLLKTGDHRRLDSLLYQYIAHYMSYNYTHLTWYLGLLLFYPVSFYHCLIHYKSEGDSHLYRQKGCVIFLFRYYKVVGKHFHSLKTMTLTRITPSFISLPVRTLRSPFYCKTTLLT